MVTVVVKVMCDGDSSGGDGNKGGSIEMVKVMGESDSGGGVKVM